MAAVNGAPGAVASGTFPSLLVLFQPTAAAFSVDARAMAQS